MSRQIHIVAACTDRKKRAVPASNRLRAIRPRGRALSEVVDAWWNQVSTSTSPPLPAGRLYAGDHWALVLDLPSLVPDSDCRLWVASAGYGLLPLTAEIRPYSATFQNKHPDSIQRFRQVSRETSSLPTSWWRELSKRQLSGSDASRAIVELAKNDSGATIIVSAGPRYVAAMEEDLYATLQVLDRPEQLILITSGGHKLPEALRSNVVPSVARLQSVVGGALTSLHARVTGKILQEQRKHALNAFELRRRYMLLVQDAPSNVRLARTRISDSEIARFVARELRSGRRPSATRLLTELRGKGLACEQSRFRKLYANAVRNQSNA